MFFSIEAQRPFIAIRMGRWEASIWRKSWPLFSNPDPDDSNCARGTMRKASGKFMQAFVSLPLVVLFWTDTTA